MRWTLIVDDAGHSGVDNMNTDYALLRRAQQGVGIVRLYRWQPGCLSFGRNEPARRRYDRDRIAALGLDTVRRPTGGRAVWHDQEVTYAVVASAETFGTLRQAYCEIHRVISTALGSLGIDTELAPGHRHAPGLGTGACFAAPVGGEVVAGRKKLVGSAQYRLDGMLLQHGSILLRNGQDVVRTVTRGDSPPTVAGDLSTLLGRNVTFQEVAATLSHTVQTAWDGEWEMKKGSYLEREYYNFDHPDWTWRR